MLTRVPVGMNFSMRQVVLRHPNSVDCDVFRKNVIRAESLDGAESVDGEVPTLGGATVISSEEEAEFEYVLLGPARMKMVGVWEPSDVNDRGDAEIQHQQQEAQIVSVAGEGQDGHFDVIKHDLIIEYPGLGIALAYEVVNTVGNVSIPPYSYRFVLNPRDDLDNLEPFISQPAEEDEPTPPIDGETPIS